MSLLSNTDFKLGNTTAAPLEAHTNGADTVFIGELESPAKGLGPDYCPDFTGKSYIFTVPLFDASHLTPSYLCYVIITGAATLKDFAFAPVRQFYHQTIPHNSDYPTP